MTEVHLKLNSILLLFVIEMMQMDDNWFFSYSDILSCFAFHEFLTSFVMVSLKLELYRAVHTRHTFLHSMHIFGYATLQNDSFCVLMPHSASQDHFFSEWCAIFRFKPDWFGSYTYRLLAVDASIVDCVSVEIAPLIFAKVHAPFSLLLFTL